MNKIKIDTNFIKLDQFLKIAQIANSGGEAKLFIKEGLIFVNGEICMQRGKKIKIGDIIEIVIDEYDDGTLEKESFEVI